MKAGRHGDKDMRAIGSRLPAWGPVVALALMLASLGMAGAALSGPASQAQAAAPAPRTENGNQARQTLPLSAFFGSWHGVGTAESNIDPYFRLTARDLDVAIQPEGEGFRVAWTTVFRDTGSPMKPKWRKRSAELTFKPTGKPNVWREAASDDPMQRPYAWAHITGHSLIVTLLRIASDGGLELQVYERTVVGDNMQLLFSRISDGERVRRAKGRLTKISDQ